MLTPFPTQTPGNRTVRSPTPAPSWMTTNGETATSLPRRGAGSENGLSDNPGPGGGGRAAAPLPAPAQPRSDPDGKVGEPDLISHRDSPCSPDRAPWR